MKLSKNTIKRTALATAMTAALGATLPGPASAAELTFSYTGWFTLIDPGGTAFANSDFPGAPMFSYRTPIAGNIIYDDVTNTGTMTMDPFSFAAAGNAIATTIAFTSVGGTQLLGNLGFNWSGNNGIPVSIVWDAQGLLEAINSTAPAMVIGDTLGPAGTGSTFVCGTDINCATAGSDGDLFNFGKFSYTLPTGPSPIVSTTFDTTDINPPITLGDNPSGTLPFTDDGISGSPMPTAPFPGWNANFDIVDLTFINTTASASDITAPADVDNTVAETPLPPGRTEPVSLGAPSNVSPPGTAEYCLTNKADCDTNNSWIANNGVNTITVSVDQVVNTRTIDWRADSGGALDSQNITVTVNDTTRPVIDLPGPMDISVDVDSISDTVCFSNDAIGHLTATDAWDPAPTIEYSVDGFMFYPSNNAAGEMDCSTNDVNTGVQFGPNANTVTWRASDSASPTANVSTYTQTVTLNLPTGITGKACELDLGYAGFRNTQGNFIMRQPDGGQTGTTDSGVTGVIDTTKLCTDPLCTNLGTGDAIVGATLDAGQPFQSLDWRAEPVTLFGPGTWTFDACPGDNSSQCDGGVQPRLLSMTVKTAAENGGVPQLGAHMLFAWGDTKDIDVVVVWDVDCGSKHLTTTDPDGDGILGSSMVDGPFIDFNAAFDISTTGIDPDGNAVPIIADGGYLVTLPAYRNPTPNSSPLPLGATEIPPGDMPADSVATESCVGGCYEFTTSDLITGSDANGSYQYAQVVLPLDRPIPFWSLYRKFDPATNTWRAFALDDRNNVKSADLDPASGACPEPGAGNYKVANFNSQLANKLEAGGNCIQLTIEDNGPNDTDATVGTVADPSGVAAVSEPKLKDPETNGDVFDAGCTISKTPVDPMKRADWWLLGGLLGWLGLSLRRKRSR